jgi:DNA-binding IclR family transcriptional regulator
VAYMVNEAKPFSSPFIGHCKVLIMKSLISEAGAGSLNRAAILLRAIAQGSRSGSLLTELVARTSLPRPTIHRVLDALMDLGWVIRDMETLRFNLGEDLAALGFSAICRNPIERCASIELSALAEKLNQVIYLGVRSGLDLVCIGRYEGPSQIQIGRGHVGLRVPFGISPSCMAMLTQLPENEAQEIIKLNLSRYHRIEGFDETGFRAAVIDARKNGYSHYDGIMLDRTTSGMGVPIFDSSGYPLAGIGTTYITGWLDKAQQQDCLQALQQAAANVTRKLLVG